MDNETLLKIMTANPTLQIKISQAKSNELENYKQLIAKQLQYATV